MENRTSWHYTPGLQLASAGVGIGPILLSRRISVSMAGVGRRETPAVWFSDDQQWETSATRAHVRRSDGSLGGRTTAGEQAIHGQGLYRFGLPSEMLEPYPSCCRTLGISLDRRRLINASARKLGSTPTNWRTLARDVPLDEPGLLFGYWLQDAWHEAAIEDIADVVVMCSETLYPLTAKAISGKA